MCWWQSSLSDCSLTKCFRWCHEISSEILTYIKILRLFDHNFADWDISGTDHIKICHFSHSLFRCNVNVKTECERILFKLVCNRKIRNFVSVQLKVSLSSEMLSKRDYVIGVILIYLTLSVLFITLNVTPKLLHEHCLQSFCLRFCCNDKEKCNSNFLDENFDQSLIGTHEELNATDVKIFYGKPKCDLEKFATDTNWTLRNASENVLNSRTWKYWRLFLGWLRWLEILCNATIWTSFRIRLLLSGKSNHNW